jgi:hypothetical protein
MGSGCKAGDYWNFGSHGFHSPLPPPNPRTGTDNSGFVPYSSREGQTAPIVQTHIPTRPIAGFFVCGLTL